MTAPPPSLEYAPGAPLRRRRWRRRIVAVVVGLGVVLPGVWRGPTLGRWAHLRYLEQRAKAYRAPPDRVVYEEDPARGSALLAQPGYRVARASGPGWNSYVGHVPPPFERLARAAELRFGGATVFCHARRTPSGRKRLVVVWLANNGVRPDAQGASPDNQVRIDFCTMVVDGGELLHEGRINLWVAPQWVAENRQTPLYARLYAGQPALADETHFTIAFDLDQYNDVIDCYLRDDDSVRLTPRNHLHMLNPR